MSLAGSAMQMVTAISFLNGSITLRAAFSILWILFHPFFELLLAFLSCLIHITRETIMVWFVTFGTCHDTTVTTQETSAILRNVVHHITIWCGAHMDNFLICSNVRPKAYLDKTLKFEISGSRKFSEILYNEWF